MNTSDIEKYINMLDTFQVRSPNPNKTIYATTLLKNPLNYHKITIVNIKLKKNTDTLVLSLVSYICYLKKILILGLQYHM